MKTRKSAAKSTSSVAEEVIVKAEEVAVQAPVAPKPLRKSTPVRKRKPAVKKVAAKQPETATVAKATKAAKPEKQSKTAKKPKLKVVRDSFTMPQNEYQKIAAIKSLCLEDGLPVKKSEVLRAGLKVLSEMGVEQMKAVLKSLEKIKTGRPNKH